MAEFIYVVRPSREGFPGDGTPEEFAVIGAHFEYLKQGLADGSVVFVGRTDEATPFGICVFEAVDLAAAEGFLAADPAIVAGIFVGEVKPFRVALMRGVDPGA